MSHKTNFPKIKFNLLPCFPAFPPCNYYTNTCAHTQNFSNVGTLEKEKGPSVSWKWRSQGPQTSKTSGNSGCDISLRNRPSFSQGTSIPFLKSGRKRVGGPLGVSQKLKNNSTSESINGKQAALMGILWSAFRSS